MKKMIRTILTASAAIVLAMTMAMGVDAQNYQVTREWESGTKLYPGDTIDVSSLGGTQTMLNYRVKTTDGNWGFESYPRVISGYAIETLDSVTYGDWEAVECHLQYWSTSLMKVSYIGESSTLAPYELILEAVLEPHRGGTSTCASKAVCEVCHKEYGELGTTHTFASAWNKDTNSHWHAATCSHTTEVADKASHEWDNGTITVEVTTTVSGKKEYKCKVCGQTKVEEIPKKQEESKPNNKPDQNIMNNMQWIWMMQDWIENQDTDTTVSSTTVGKKVTVGRFVYTIEEAKQVVLNNSKNKLISSAVVPSKVTINGSDYKVTGISTRAFAGCKMLTSVEIGSNVESIGRDAFAGCPKLKVVKIKSGKLTEVKDAFRKSFVITVKLSGSGKTVDKALFAKKNCGKKVFIK